MVGSDRRRRPRPILESLGLAVGIACAGLLVVVLVQVRAARQDWNVTDVAGTIREHLAPLPVVHFERVLSVAGPRGTFTDKASLDWPAAKGEDEYQASLEQAHRCWDLLLESKTLRLRAEAGL